MTKNTWNQKIWFLLINLKITKLFQNLLIVLIIGSFTGGFFGAHLSKLNGNILIKKTFITVCILVGISLLFKSIKGFL